MLISDFNPLLTSIVSIQSEFGSESASCKINFFFPNQSGIGLENYTQFLGVTFPNQTRFGLEKDTEWNVAEVKHP